MDKEQLILKKVVVQSMLDESDAPMKVSVPKLKNFKGVNNANDLENFFKDMEEDFQSCSYFEEIITLHYNNVHSW